MAEQGSYYVPHHSALPIINAVGLFFLGLGSVEVLDNPNIGIVLLSIGVAITITTLSVWFATCTRESMQGLHNAQMNRTYRWGIFWYLLAQFFLAFIFLGAMFYVRMFSVPWMGGLGSEEFRLTHLLLWPNFQAVWPLLSNPAPHEFVGPTGLLSPWGKPLVATLIMLASAGFMRGAIVAIKRGKNKVASLSLGVLLILALGFVTIHGLSLAQAMNEYKLTIFSGIYGSLFFMINVVLVINLLSSFVFLVIVFIRSLKGHFSAQNHFSVSALSYMWYFVVILWLVMFVYVYWL